VIGWLRDLVDRIAGWFYRRLRGLVESPNMRQEERRAAVRNVRDALGEAMTMAGKDRLHGGPDDRDAAIEAAGRAATFVHEVDDREARDLVKEWKRQFDAIPKGWRESFQGSLPGYPEAEWTSLSDAADRAQERLGAALRELLN